MRIAFVATSLWHEPLGIMHLSASLKCRGHEVSFVVGGRNEIIERLQRIKPQVLAYSIVTGAHKYYLELNNEIKRELDVLSVFGGPHPTFFPEMIGQEGVDAICQGEGDRAFPDLLDVLEIDESLRIPGIWIKRNSTIYRNAPGPLIEDLDELPFCDRELVYAVSEESRNSRVKFFLASRGCPYNCSYCYNQSLREMYRGKGKYVRQRSVDNLLAEIGQVQSRYPLGMVFFLDDVFVTSNEWLERFSSHYRTRISLPFLCQIRPDIIDENVVALLKQAGCIAVSLGIETGNMERRQKLLQRKVTDEEIVTACALLRKSEIRVCTLNMIGIPGETMKTVLETLDLNIACHPDFALASIYQPYPRTTLGDKTKDMGLFNGDYDRMPSSFYEASVLNFDDESFKKGLVNLHRIFSLVVSFPVLRPIVPLLVRLPLGVFRFVLWRTWQDYAYSKRMLGYQFGLANLLKILTTNLRAAVKLLERNARRTHG
jgi:anaerobic magnesium-protoporphyrin IX monomethyl ester cyclase